MYIKVLLISVIFGVVKSELTTSQPERAPYDLLDKHIYDTPPDAKYDAKWPNTWRSKPEQNIHAQKGEKLGAHSYVRHYDAGEITGKEFSKPRSVKTEEPGESSLAYALAEVESLLIALESQSAFRQSREPTAQLIHENPHLRSQSTDSDRPRDYTKNSNVIDRNQHSQEPYRKPTNLDQYDTNQARGKSMNPGETIRKPSGELEPLRNWDTEEPSGVSTLDITELAQRVLYAIYHAKAIDKEQHVDKPEHQGRLETVDTEMGLYWDKLNELEAEAEKYINKTKESAARKPASGTSHFPPPPEASDSSQLGTKQTTSNRIINHPNRDPWTFRRDLSIDIESEYLIPNSVIKTEKEKGQNTDSQEEATFPPDFIYNTAREPSARPRQPNPSSNRPIPPKVIKGQTALPGLLTHRLLPPPPNRPLPPVPQSSQMNTNTEQIPWHSPLNQPSDTNPSRKDSPIYQEIDDQIDRTLSDRNALIDALKLTLNRLQEKLARDRIRFNHLESAIQANLMEVVGQGAPDRRRLENNRQERLGLRRSYSETDNEDPFLFPLRFGSNQNSRKRSQSENPRRRFE